MMPADFHFDSRCGAKDLSRADRIWEKIFIKEWTPPRAMEGPSRDFEDPVQGLGTGLADTQV